MAAAATCVDTTEPRAVSAVCATGLEAALFDAHLADINHVSILAAASEESERAYERKKTPKGKPWPKEKYVHEMKHIRPAKVCLVGPDFCGVTSMLQLLA